MMLYWKSLPAATIGSATVMMLVAWSTRPAGSAVRSMVEAFALLMASQWRFRSAEKASSLKLYWR